MAKPLEIKVRLDRSQAKAGADAHVADARRMTDATARSVAEQKKAMASALTEVQVAERAKAALIEETNRKRIQAAKESMSAEKEASGSFLEGMGGMVGAVARLGAAYGFVGVAMKGVSAIAQMWKDQRKDIEDSVDRLTQYREKVLELASLKDRLGQSTPETKAQLEFRAATLQSADAAIAFQSGALNTGQSAYKSGRISEPDFQQAMKYAGAFQGAVPQLNPSAFGSLVGMMPSLMGGKNQSPEDVFRRTVGLYKIFELGGSSPSEAFEQFGKNTGLTLGGAFKSPEEQATLQSFFSIASHGEAGDKVNQFVRATGGLMLKNKDPRLEGSVSQVEYGQQLGVTDTMKPMEIGRLIAADLKAQAEKKGADFKPEDYLARHGFLAQELQYVLRDFAIGENSGTFEDTFGKAARGEAIPTFGDANQKVKEFQATDPVALSRQASLAKDLADTTVATGPEEFYKKVKELAFQSLRTQGKISGELKDWDGSALWGGPILDEARRMMEVQAEKAGVGVSGFNAPEEIGGVSLHERLGGGWQNRMFTSEATRSKYFYELGTDITAAGGKSIDLAEMLRLMRKQVEIAERNEARARSGVRPDPTPMPAPLPGAPPAGPTR